MNKIEYVDVSKDFIVCNKPYGLPTTFKNVSDDSDCLVKFVLRDYPEVSKVRGYNNREGGLMYRLDNNTTGIVVFARNNEAFSKFKNWQESGRITKEYLAICKVFEKRPQGKKRVTPPRKVILSRKTESGLQFECVPNDFADRMSARTFYRALKSFAKQEYKVVDMCILHSKKTERKMVVVKKRRGKYVTFYRILERFGGYCLISVCISKGMRHQIRVHLATIGLPILGDELYGGGTDKRMYLHCYKVYKRIMLEK